MLIILRWEIVIKGCNENKCVYYYFKYDYMIVLLIYSYFYIYKWGKSYDSILIMYVCE